LAADGEVLPAHDAERGSKPPHRFNTGDEAIVIHGYERLE
jgi:hypothetical protein